MLDDFEMLFNQGPETALPKVNQIYDQLKQQGIAHTPGEKTKLLKQACFIYEREKQIIAQEKAQKEAKEAKEAKEKAKQKPNSSKLNKKESKPTDWAKKITDGLWRYRVIIAAILILLVLLTFSALFWPAMVGFAFTVVEMASAVLAAKIATLFVVTLISLCLMGYLKWLQPQASFIKLDEELRLVPASKKYSHSDALLQQNLARDTVPRSKAGVGSTSEDTGALPPKPATTPS